ncbi:MAG: hypothetical protein AAFR81_22630 [Chloroflexota bacterium]
MYHRWGFLSVLFICVGIVTAQIDACPIDLDLILEAVTDSCDGVERNEVCYGNVRVESELLDDEVVFDNAGDIIPVSELVTLTTSPFDEETDEWGIALFRVQANLPDTLPGQNVTILAFGDTELIPEAPASDDQAQTMNVFSLTTGIGQPTCNDIPEGGVVIQNPADTEITMIINGFQVTMGSTALFTATTPNDLSFTTLDGTVTITDDAETSQTVPVGFSTSVIQDEPLPEEPLPAPDTGLPLAPLLPEPIPETGEPPTEAVALINCAFGGGATVTAGADVYLRGGWADYTLASVIGFATNNPPTISVGGEAVNYSYRTGPGDWTDAEGVAGFRMDWYWLVESIPAGETTVDWVIDGQTLTCILTAN